MRRHDRRAAGGCIVERTPTNDGTASSVPSFGSCSFAEGYEVDGTGGRVVCPRTYDSLARCLHGPAPPNRLAIKAYPTAA